MILVNLKVLLLGWFFSDVFPMRRQSVQGIFKTFHMKRACLCKSHIRV